VKARALMAGLWLLCLAAAGVALVWMLLAALAGSPRAWRLAVTPSCKSSARAAAP